MYIIQKIKNLSFQFNEDLQGMDYDSVYVRYLGKKGEINKLLAEIKKLPNKQRVDLLKAVNDLKKQINKEIKVYKQDFPNLDDGNVDLTIPVNPTKKGNLHPITRITRELNRFFHYYGFSVYDGPEIENDYYNFEMMGVSVDHPARELQDTLYLMEPEWLLRTQTSNIEARELERQNPPIRFVLGGKVFRNETENKSNGALFHQYQGVCVDRNITIGHLKWMFEKSLKFILGDDTKIRFRAKYYPEVEPGLSPDIRCTFCKGKGCDVCKNRGWIEIAGGGMIHPTTLEKAGINHKQFSGFAFGWGLDRIAMARFNIRDIRLLFNGSIVYKT